MTKPPTASPWPRQRVCLVPGGRETARNQAGTARQADRKVRRYAKEETEWHTTRLTK